MPSWPKSVAAPRLDVRIEPLDQDAFAPFGTVVQNPTRAGGRASQRQLRVVDANQGSARKYIDVSHLTNHYGSARSRQPAKPVVNMFVCRPRTLRRRRRAGAGAGAGASSDRAVGSGVEEQRVFDVGVLERHPFTPQTFVPMGLRSDDTKTKYLVVVAPTLPHLTPASSVADKVRKMLSPWSSAAPVSDADPTIPKPKGNNLPDLSNVRAFIADGSQAVTYGPGTWHAPMVVLGEDAIDFVVIQYANGVADDDVQEVFLQNGEGGGVTVTVEAIPDSRAPLKAKL